jgi:hypothetical protein
LHYYNDASITESERHFYNDDGLTPNAFEKGQYELLDFEYELERNGFEIEFECETGKHYAVSTKKIDLIIHHFQTEPKRIKINNKKVDFDWDEQNNTLTIPVIWNTNKELEIKVKTK